ncbi:MAG: TonB family protein [Terracidiphilus sp.]
MRPIELVSLLLGMLALPIAAVASSPTIDVTASMHHSQFSTGITPVRILERPKSVIAPDPYVNGLSDLVRVNLNLDVDREGRAADIRVINSDDPYLNTAAVAAVRQFRWRPARLDHHSITVPLNLSLIVQR